MANPRGTEEGDKHFTVSAYLVSDEAEPRILLIFHKKLNRWMQPGGHVERKENIIDALRHEVLEETGIKLNIKSPKEYLDGSVEQPLPFYIQVQPIPAFGDEPAHHHIDMGYKFVVKHQKPKPGAGESQRVDWFTKQEVSKIKTIPSVKAALLQAFDEI